jgi:hypothetical protein
VEDDIRVRWAWLNSLIVTAKGGHLCAFVAHVCRVAKLIPCKVTIDSNLRDTLGYG